MRNRSMTRGRRALLLSGGAAKAIGSISHRAGKVRGRREARASSRPGLTLFLAGSGAGAAAVYFLDSQQGKRRRHVLRDWTMARLRRGSREAGKKARYMSGKVEGIVAEATPPGRDSSELNDPALEAKVESELFKPENAPKDTVDVNVQEGVVVLRGQVSSDEQLRELVERAEAIDGVSRAESQLQVAGR